VDASTKPPQPRAGVDKTLTKGLNLLEALAETEGPRGISELANQLSLNKSNVHRLLQTLVLCGYVTREPSTERYLLSSKLWRVARRGRPFDALRRAVRPVLLDLAHDIDESVLFVVVQDDEMVPIDQVETHNPVRVYFTVGQAFPIDQVVMTGKALTALQLIALAERSQMEARSAARNAQRQLKKSTAFAEQELARIADARKNGFAVSRGEWVSGANAVAVPVKDSGQELIGVLSCFGPADRLTDANLKKIQRMLSVAAQELSRRICE
jgi:IclR family KDG regulon transcriptional repressor